MTNILHVLEGDKFLPPRFSSCGILAGQMKKMICAPNSVRSSHVLTDGSLIVADNNNRNGNDEDLVSWEVSINMDLDVRNQMLHCLAIIKMTHLKSE